MKFEVVRKQDNKVMMYTEHESCIDFQYFDSQEQAGYYFRLDGKKMSGKAIKAHFGYSDKSNDSPSISNDTKIRKVRPIRCINNGKQYKNMSEAGKDLGLDSALISYSLKVGRPTKGYSFEFVDDEE